MLVEVLPEQLGGEAGRLGTRSEWCPQGVGRGRWEVRGMDSGFQMFVCEGPLMLGEAGEAVWPGPDSPTEQGLRTQYSGGAVQKSLEARQDHSWNPWPVATVNNLSLFSLSNCS